MSANGAAAAATVAAAPHSLQNANGIPTTPVTSVWKGNEIIGSIAHKYCRNCGSKESFLWKQFIFVMCDMCVWCIGVENGDSMSATVIMLHCAYSLCWVEEKRSVQHPCRCHYYHPVAYIFYAFIYSSAGPAPAQHTRQWTVSECV